MEEVAVHRVELVREDPAFEVDVGRGVLITCSVPAVSGHEGAAAVVEAVPVSVLGFPFGECLAVRPLDVEPVLHRRRQAVPLLRTDDVVGVVGFELLSTMHKGEGDVRLSRSLKADLLCVGRLQQKEDSRHGSALSQVRTGIKVRRRGRNKVDVGGGLTSFVTVFFFGELKRRCHFKSRHGATCLLRFNKEQ